VGNWQSRCPDCGDPTPAKEEPHGEREQGSFTALLEAFRAGGWVPLEDLVPDSAARYEPGSGRTKTTRGTSRFLKT